MEKTFLSFVFVLCFSAVSLAQWAKPELVQEVLDGKRSEALASWWGFDAEDSTQFLQAAIDSGARKLIIDRQASDWITLPLKAASNQEIVLQDGVVLQAKKGAYLGTSDALLSLRQCENVVIRGEKPGAKAFIRMNKADYQKPPYKPAEWRHGLSILSSSNVLVEDLTIEFTGGDGIYLGVCKAGVTCSDITIRRVLCYENHRQGISVITARNLLIEDTIMRDTNGTAPQAGIDFEPNRENEELTNCVMRRCVCEGNAGDGYEFYLPNLTSKSGTLGITLEDCVSRNNKRSGLNWILTRTRPTHDADPIPGTFVVKNFVTENEGGCGISLHNNPINSVKVTFENVKVVNPANTPVRLVSSSDQPGPFGDVTFKNVEIQDDNPPADDPNREFFKFSDGSSDAWGIESVSGELVCKRGGKTETLVIDEAWLQANYPVKNSHHLPMVRFDAKDLASTTAAEPGKFNPMRVRGFARYFFDVKAGQPFEFSLRFVQVGRNTHDPIDLNLVGPDGKRVKLEKLPINETRRYVVPDPKNGIYTLECGPNSHSFVLTEPTVPVALDVSRVNFISAAGKVYFRVPEGTKDFGVCVMAEGAEKVNAAVYAPNGEKRWEMKDIDSSEFFYPDPAEAEKGGVWCVQFMKPEKACFEDFHLRIQNILPVVTFREGESWK